eukprot:7925971-Ditylum_brightwellii.AAC.1
MAGKIRLKRVREEELAPNLIANLFSKKDKTVMIQALVNLGATKGSVAKKFIEDLTTEKTNKTSWSTVAGKIQTNGKISAKLKLAELNPTADIEYKFHVMPALGKYDMGIGRDLLKVLGLIIDFENKLITWGKYCTIMKATSVSADDFYLISNPKGVDKLIVQMAGDSYKKF